MDGQAKPVRVLVVVFDPPADLTAVLAAIPGESVALGLTHDDPLTAAKALAGWALNQPKVEG